MKLRPLPPSVFRLHYDARRIFRRALAKGEVVAKNVCERCGRKRKDGASRLSLDGVEAHHPDYTQPLLVEWLCHWCHLSADCEQRQRDRSMDVAS